MDWAHNKKIQEYINKVCIHVRFRDVHQDVNAELKVHIQENIEEYLKKGFSEEEAVERAISQMGNADMVGRQLNVVHKPKKEWTIVVLYFLFVNIGLLSIHFIQKQSLLTYNSNVFEKSLLYSLIGLVTIIGLYFLDYRRLENFSKHIYLGALIILIMTVFWGIEVLGSKSWLLIGPFSINFVAVSPVFFIIALAGIFNKWDWSNPFTFLKGVALFAMPLIFILKAPSVSTGIIYMIASTVLMIASGAKIKQIILLTVSMMAILISSFIINSSGALPIQLSKIIPNSELVGQGFTLDPKIIPEVHTDFIFTYITYTFGWIASIMLITFIILFLVRIWGVAKQVKTNYGKLLVNGFLSILVIQFLWNILMNFGLAPLSAMGLPFISYSGSQLIINTAVVGIILSIYRRKNLSPNDMS